MAFETLLGNDRLKKNLSESLARGHISHFYLISGPSGSGKHTLANLLAELVLLRREIAQSVGYDSYRDFAWDFYYYRDYTPEQMESYMAEISRELVPVYRDMAQSDVWDYSYRRSSESQIMDYVRQAAKKFGVSKSTVHKDITERLSLINPSLANQTRRVLNLNKAERHIRGGLATKHKYEAQNSNH